MPTLDDLRAVFTDLEERAPLPQHRPVTEPPAPRRGRRRSGTAVLAAAAVAAVAVGVTVFANPSHPQRATTATRATTRPPAQASPRTPPAAFPTALTTPRRGGSPQLRFGFAVDPVAGYRVTPNAIDASSQSADIRSPGGSVTGELRIYYARAFDPTTVKRGTPVSVDGRPGYYARLHMPGGGSARYDALAWQYAPEGWAVVDLWDQAAGRTQRPRGPRSRNNRPVIPSHTHGLPGLAALQTDQLRVATATHAADTSVQVPMKITGLSGQVTSLAPDPVAGGLTVTLSGRTWYFGWGNSELDPADKPATDTTTFDGQQWVIYHDRISGTITSLGLSAPGFGMTITTHGDPLSLTDYQQFLAHLSFPSDLGDPDTWFDADTALP